MVEAVNPCTSAISGKHVVRRNLPKPKRRTKSLLINCEAFGERAYVDGIWSSSIAYRESTSTFYWLGCIDFASTYIYTASSPEGSWEQQSIIPNCYYDAGLLIDDDDTIVAQLSNDGLSEVSTQQVFSTPEDIGTLEGSRFYKRDGQYYIFMTRPANGQYIIKSSSPMQGYGDAHQVLLDMATPISGGGVPHQGSLVSTADDNWYYMGFDSDGWPVITTVNSGWGSNYPFPLPESPVNPTTGTDKFPGTKLGPAWEWNHNPDTSAFSVDDGLTLSAGTVTDDIYSARNTLTRRIHGPEGSETLELDFSGMADGDRAGLALLRDQSAYVGIARDGDSFAVNYVDGITMDTNWETTSPGTVGASEGIQLNGTVWLRIVADIAPGGSNAATFHYSTDGSTFAQIGGSFTMSTDWHFFIGYRYGIFEFATQALGGSVKVVSFKSE
ncbi:glycosyl hydrolase [Aspergillus lucknowensis]|uniref:Glycosyl hydrolase n=1 Tax=Aspergillus lucknowensis TaxID=176173 RepID=A0ABR4LNU0_9EURO